MNFPQRRQSPGMLKNKIDKVNKTKVVIFISEYQCNANKISLENDKMSSKVDKMLIQYW